MRASPLPLLMAAALLPLTACNRSPDADLAKLDNQIIGNDTDPALTSALEDQIMVDPALTQQSNKNAARAPKAAGQAQYPLPSGAAKGGSQVASSGAAAGKQPTRAADSGEIAAGVANCGPQLNYSAVWARRLPPAFSVLPGARITEAAGSDTAECRARVVTFTTSEAPQRVIDHYRSRAAGAGYSAEHKMRDGDHILAGTAGEAAFYLILTPLRGGGSDVAMITNAG